MQLLKTSGYLDMENTTEYFPLLFCHYRPSIFVTESFAATLLLAPLVTAQCDVLHKGTDLAFVGSRGSMVFWVLKWSLMWLQQEKNP